MRSTIVMAWGLVGIYQNTITSIVKNTENIKAQTNAPCCFYACSFPYLCFWPPTHGVEFVLLHKHHDKSPTYRSPRVTGVPSDH
jgi:hypothetical protein